MPFNPRPPSSQYSKPQQGEATSHQARNLGISPSPRLSFPAHSPPPANHQMLSVLREPLTQVPSAHPSPCLVPLCHSAPFPPPSTCLPGAALQSSAAYTLSVTFSHPREESPRLSAMSTCHYLPGACMGLGAFALDGPSLSNSSSSPFFRHSSSAIPSTKLSLAPEALTLCTVFPRLSPPHDYEALGRGSVSLHSVSPLVFVLECVFTPCGICGWG